jgi:folate-dependent phosphoribosylglycinamide formyltransferase PurN
VRTALICHHDNDLNRLVLPRWLATFSDPAGVVVITETRARLGRRLRREWRRSRLRTLDVLAFRLYYRLRLAAVDRRWVTERLEAELERYPAVEGVPVHETDDPNSEATRRFLAGIRPDIVLARCKTLLRPEVFGVAREGTFVVHPGVCPEYRNAHGCFWALARRDLGRVGATLLRIDEGVDTGPVYAYYGSEVDERRESHVVIQHRVVFDNLDAIARDLTRIHAGAARPVEVAGRASAAWGQPRLVDYLRWKRAAIRAAT